MKRDDTKTKKLVLNKETLRTLKDADLSAVAGGMPPETEETQCGGRTCYNSCGKCCGNC